MTRRFKLNEPALAGLRFTWDAGYRNFNVVLDDKLLASFPDPGALRAKQELVPLPDGSTLAIGLVRSSWKNWDWDLEVLRDGVPLAGLSPGAKRIPAAIAAMLLGTASLLIGLLGDYSLYHKSHAFHGLYRAFSVGWSLPESFESWSPARESLERGNGAPVVCGILVLALGAVALRFPLAGFAALIAILAADTVLLVSNSWGVQAGIGALLAKLVWIVAFASAFAEAHAQRPPGEDRTVTKLGI